MKVQKKLLQFQYREDCQLFSLIFNYGNTYLFAGEFFQNSYVHCKTYWATSSFGTHRLLSDDNKIKISELLLTSNSVVRDYVDHLKWLLLPLLAGIGVTILTWNIIYIDSYIPGINPPTPFSPTKNRYVY